MERQLSADGLADRLAGGQPVWRVQLVDRTGSTNADLLAGVRQGRFGPYTALIARCQVAGRGRLDRSWQMVPGQSLALSASLPLLASPERWGVVPLMAGVAVVEAVAEFGVAARLKWPNDVLVDRRKLAGVLVEVSGTTAVVGIGLNVGQTDRTVGGPDRVSLAMVGVEAAIEAVAAAILVHLAPVVAQPDLAAYRRHCDTIGRFVRVTRPAGDPVEGRAVAVADDGQLVVDRGHGQVESLAAGDVRHVR